jgi:hypothetical protein
MKKKNTMSSAALAKPNSVLLHGTFLLISLLSLSSSSVYAHPDLPYLQPRDVPQDNSSTQPDIYPKVLTPLQNAPLPVPKYSEKQGLPPDASVHTQPDSSNEVNSLVVEPFLASVPGQAASYEMADISDLIDFGVVRLEEAWVKTLHKAPVYHCYMDPSRACGFEIANIKVNFINASSAFVRPDSSTEVHSVEIKSFLDANGVDTHHKFREDTNLIYSGRVHLLGDGWREDSNKNKDSRKRKFTCTSSPSKSGNCAFEIQKVKIKLKDINNSAAAAAALNVYHDGKSTPAEPSLPFCDQLPVETAYYGGAGLNYARTKPNCLERNAKVPESLMKRNAM